MRTRLIILCLPVLAVILGYAGLHRPKQVAPSATPPTMKAVVKTPAAFSPGLDDLMTILVQPRHIRLYYAGAHRNWELAAAESRNLQASFARLAVTVPNYQGNDVKASIDALIAPQMKDMDLAIAAADYARFSKAYEDLTGACNACHTYMEHPFLVIQVPSGREDTAHSDQSYAPVE